MPQNCKEAFEKSWKNNPDAAIFPLNTFLPVPENNKSEFDFCDITVRVWVTKNLVLIRGTCGSFSSVQTRFIPGNRCRISSYIVWGFNFNK